VPLAHHRDLDDSIVAVTVMLSPNTPSPVSTSADRWPLEAFTVPIIQASGGISHLAATRICADRSNRTSSVASMREFRR